MKWWVWLMVTCYWSAVSSTELDHYLNEFAVKLESGADIAELAEHHNLRLIRQVPGLDDVYLLEHRSVSHRSKRSATIITDVLQEDPRVQHAEQQIALRRVKRTIVHDKQWELPIRHYADKSVYQRVYDQDDQPGAKEKRGHISRKIKEAGFNDQYFADQWYLINDGQTGGTPGYDVNVLPVWKKGYTGQGVVVSILDDGIDHTHPDLRDNYDPEASADVNDRSDRDNDPMPNKTDNSNSHGTRCAGEVAAKANNSVCGVGIAFNAKIGGVRMLDGTITDSLEAEALTYNNQHVDIYSASWGPSDDGKTMEGPGRFATEALENGIKKGRGGKGSIFVWATGNGGVVEDDCSCDGYVSSIYTLSIGCISDKGLSTYFSEICPSTMAVIFTGGDHLPPGKAIHIGKPHIKVVTTDLNGQCTLDFQGTSSAAPLAAGCFALVLEANGMLTWRDVQHIVVQTARVPNSEEEGWTVNGAGFHVNNRFGFGAIDCGRMVEVAQTWTNVPTQHRCEVAANNPSREIPRGGTINQTLECDGCGSEAGARVDYLEHTQVHLNIDHPRRGDLSVSLYSPAGTRSEVLSIRPLDESSEGIHYTFMTVHNWGEPSEGTWLLSVTDMSPDRGAKHADGHTVGSLVSWSLALWGYAFAADDQSAPKRVKPTDANSLGAHEAQEVELKELMAAEEKSAEHLEIVETKETSADQLSDDDIRTLATLFNDDLEPNSQPQQQQQHVTRSRLGLKRLEKSSRGVGQTPEEVLAGLSQQDQDVMEKILTDRPVSPTHYRRLLHDLEYRMQNRNYQAPNGKKQPTINVDQRSLLDDAMAEVLPQDDDKQTEEEQTNDNQKDAKNTPHNTNNNYEDIIAEIEDIIEILN